MVIHLIVQKVMETMESTFIVFFEKQTKLASSVAHHGVGTALKGENCAHECSYNISRVYTYTTTYKEVYEVCNLNPINHGSNSILLPLFIYTFESPIEFFFLFIFFIWETASSSDFHGQFISSSCMKTLHQEALCH